MRIIDGTLDEKAAAIQALPPGSVFAPMRAFPAMRLSPGGVQTAEGEKTAAEYMLGEWRAVTFPIHVLREGEDAGVTPADPPADYEARLSRVEAALAALEGPKVGDVIAPSTQDEFKAQVPVGARVTDKGGDKWRQHRGGVVQFKRGGVWVPASEYTVQANNPFTFTRVGGAK